ncbi:MAG: inositol monophosphatase [Thermoplasmata archaeon]|nr:MAG: inositol monophosphatase [Thermoplasmata archaeon]
MSENMDEEFKILAREIIKKIDRKIRSTIKKEPYKLAKTIDIGADGTPTKYIDKIAENVAIKTIKNAEVSVDLLSEEAGFIDNDGEYLFVLDPVDGTRNAMRGIPFFSVSLAIGKKKLSDIEYGIVKNIANKDEFIVEKHHGAFLNKKPVVIPDMPSSEILYSITLGKNKEAFARYLTFPHTLRCFGCASLEMCMVATGALDGYIVSHEHIRVIDIAASTLFVREAGGIVTDIKGKTLEMMLNLDERVSIIAAGNPQVTRSIAKNF